MVYEPEYRGDWDCYDDEEDQAVCVCEDYVGAEHPVYCRACRMWTDNKELLMAEPALIEAMLTNTNRVMAAVYQAMDKKEKAA